MIRAVKFARQRHSFMHVSFPFDIYSERITLIAIIDIYTLAYDRFDTLEQHADKGLFMTLNSFHRYLNERHLTKERTKRTCWKLDSASVKHL